MTYETPSISCSTSVSAYYENSLGTTAMLDEACKDIPISSTCGQDCKRAIDAAEGMLEAARMAYGEASNEWHQVRKLTAKIVNCFVCG